MMLAGQRIYQIGLSKVARQFSSCPVMFDKSVNDPKPSDANTQGHNKINTTATVSQQLHSPSPFEKRILVWVKRYPSIAEVPDTVTFSAMQTATSRARVKLCKVMMVFFAVLFFGAALSGRSAARKGESLTKQRNEWHDKVRKENEKEIAATK